jgi:hypothetical protein
MKDDVYQLRAVVEALDKHYHTLRSEGFRADRIRAAVRRIAHDTERLLILVRDLERYDAGR